MNLIRLLVHLFHLSLAEELNGQLIFNEGLIEDGVVLEFSRGEEAHHQDEVIGDRGVAEHGDHIIESLHLAVVELLNEEVLHILEDYAFELRLQEVLLRFFEFFQHFLLQPTILAHMDGLENGEGEGSIEAAAISACFPVLRVVLMQILDLDVEAFIVHELIQHQRDGPELADQRGLRLHFLADLLLLLLVQQQLRLVLVLITLH